MKTAVIFWRTEREMLPDEHCTEDSWHKFMSNPTIKVFDDGKEFESLELYANTCCEHSERLEAKNDW